MRRNIQTVKVETHEGGKASRIPAKEELLRSVLSCLLWEQTFYEDGVEIAQRINDLVMEVGKKDPNYVHTLAIKARRDYNLRHCPLWMCVGLAKIGKLSKTTVYSVIQRADELSEIVSLYWQDGKKSLPAQLKKGIADAFNKFDEYQFAKYNRDNPIKLRDVMFLTHPYPKDDKQAEIFRKLASNELQTPDTWEVALSIGKDKKETWERLIGEKKLGYMALLRNLRNMSEVGVDEKLIESAVLNGAGRSRLFPYRFISAAKAVPRFEPFLEEAMLLSLKDNSKLLGKTVFIVDVSGSMNWALSNNSEIKRIDAAASLAILLREICEECVIYTFSDKLVLIPARHGFALRDAIVSSQEHRNTYLKRAMLECYEKEKFDRMIIITDEQTQDGILYRRPNTKGYVIDVAPYKYEVGFGDWIHVHGFSESVVNFIQELENVF